MSKLELSKTLHEKTIAGFSGDDVWLTVTDVSNLTGLNPATIREACSKRNGSYRGGRYTYRKEGKRYEILLISLPEPIQAKYWLEHHKPQHSDLPVVYENNQGLPFDHEMYEALADSYNRKAPSIKAEAQRRLLILDEYLQLLQAGFKQKSALNILSERYKKISRATLHRLVKRIDKHPRHYWEILLATDYQGRSKTEIPEAAINFFMGNWLSQNKPDASVIYNETIKAAKAQNWGQLPSYKTFLRRIKDLPENVRILGRDGPTALKQKLPHQRRDYTTLCFHQLWESDGRKADVYCRWPDDTIRRPFVVIWREVRTRVVLSVRIYHFANGEIVMESFESALRRADTIPEGVILDNGREYANKSFTGGQKNRYRFIVKENEPIGALTRLGVKVHWTTPYHGAAKPVERLWGVLAKNVDCRFPKAYTGRNPVERPEDSDLKHAIPIDQFAARLIQGIHEFHHTPHGGQGMFDKTPHELYAELSKEYTPNKPTKLQLTAMRPYAFRVKLRSQYFFEFTLKGFGKVRYEPPEELKLTRTYEYDVLPDNADPTAPALVFDGERYLGEASYQWHTAFDDSEAGGKTLKKRANTVKQTRNQLKAIQGEIPALPAFPGEQTTLPPLPQAENIIKLPLETPPSRENNTLEIQEDGSIKNTQTGEITTKSEPKFKPFSAASDSTEKEIEQLRLEQQKKNLPEWMRQNQVKGEKI
jgi:putative transposase